MLQPFFLVSKSIWTWLPKVQAHRGFWQDVSEQNTLLSFQQAMIAGFEMIEFDVRLTKDQQVVLFHDESFEGKNVCDWTLQDIRLKFPVNTLQEIFEWHRKTKSSIKLNIEIKSQLLFDWQTERNVSQLIKEFKIKYQYDLEPFILFSSFNPFSLFKLRLLSENTYRALLFTLENHPKNSWILKKMIFNFLAAPHVLNLDYRYWPQVQKLKHHWNVPVVLWTVNHLSVARNYINAAKQDVFGIITDTILPKSI